MYTNHPSNKHDERAKEKKKKREALKMGKYQRTRDGEISTGNSGSSKSLTMSSYIKSELCTDCVIYQDDITKMIGLY